MEDKRWPGDTSVDLGPQRRKLVSFDQDGKGLTILSLVSPDRMHLDGLETWHLLQVLLGLWQDQLGAIVPFFSPGKRLEDANAVSELDSETCE